jgi:serine/threonine protein kinase/TolB-like protein/Tfp pilus assembly protein PilF
MTPGRWQRIKELFQSAVERDPSERAAFLQEACACDPELQSEVESLLAQDASGSGLLNSPGKTAQGVLFHDQHESVVGKRIGPYQVMREIGHGGMGAVYLAARVDAQYQKQVAIKLVKRGMDTDAIVRRFRNECQILANLDHPHIAKLLDGGTTDDGLSYFVMDYVEGLPIDVFCDTHKLPTVERLTLFRTVCSAVHYAHEHHIVHRDLKPTNILVTAERAPKLLDFGIAKLLDPVFAGQTVEPTAGPLPMTPQYASPEHVRAQPITPASDVYSLGVLLYELLTGHRPYQLRTRTPEAIQHVICEQEPAKPSRAVTRVEELPCPDRQAPITLTPESVSATREGRPDKLRRKLAGDLDNIVLMAMRKEPMRRYGSVEAFSEDIRRYLEGLPIVARKDTPTYRGAKFMTRNKAGVMAATLIMVLLIALIGVGIPRLPPGDKAIRSVAVLPFVNLSADQAQEYLADGMTEELIADLAQIGALRVISRTSVMQFQGARKSLPEIARHLKVDAVIEASVLRSGERVRVTAQLIDAGTERHLWARTYDRDLRDVQVLQSQLATAIAREMKTLLTPRERSRLAAGRQVDRDAYEAYLKGRFFWSKRSAANLKRAQELFQQAIEKDPGYAAAYAGLADSYFLVPFDSDTPPRDYFPKVKDAATRALAIDDTLAEAHLSLARALQLDWDWPGVERELRRVLELNPSDAQAHRQYGSYLSAMGRHQEAIAEGNRAQELDPLSPATNEMAGRRYYHARQYDQALEQDRKALELDPNFWMAHLFSSRAYAQKGMYAEALAELGGAREITPEILSDSGYVYAASGRVQEAQRNLEELISLSRQRYVPPIYIVHIYAGLGQKDQAFAWLEEALEGRDGRLAWLKVDHMLDSIRSDPRFAAILRRLRLPT